MAKAYESAKLKNPNYTPVRKTTQTTNPDKKQREEFPAVNSLGVEGEDHINTHFQSDSELGRALSTYGSYPFNHPEYGRFRTVHGFMCWLGNPNQPDSYRNMPAYAVEKHRLSSASVPVKNYRFKLMEATWLKIQVHPEIGRKLAESNLRLDHYYLNHLSPGSGNNKKRIRIRPDTAPVVIRAFEEIRKALIENRSPCFDFLLHESERAAYLKNLRRECENLVVTLTPRQESELNEKDPNAKPTKNFSPSQKKYRKKYFENQRKKRDMTLVQAEDGSMEHRPVAEASEPVGLPVGEPSTPETKPEGSPEPTND